MRDFDWSKAPIYRETLVEFDEKASQWFGDQLPSSQRTTRRRIPSASQIVRFWYRWAKLVVKSHESPGSEGLPAFARDLFIDLGEPFCFGCRVRYAEWELAHAKIKSTRKGLAALYDHWNILPLERAHIIPLSRGGSNRLRNFVLLCPHCHEESPDVIDSLVMLRWLQNRKPFLANKYFREWIEACLQIDVDPYDAQRKEAEVRIRYRDEFDEFRARFSTNHFNTYSWASYVACIVEFAKQKDVTGTFGYDVPE
jgi:5-methylcytosine-specific restriction endonuclease McrA